MLKIAVIGSGMAGLAAARILKDAGHDVVIFEALKGKGMDSHSLDVDGGIIDSPLRVMNPLIWKNTLALAHSVGIKMFQVNTYMSCNWMEIEAKNLKPDTWLTTQRTQKTRLPFIADKQFAQKNLVSLLKGWVEFRLASKKFLKLPKQERQKLTLSDFMNRYKIEDKFWHGCMMPVLYTLCTCSEKSLGNWTAEPLIHFLLKMQKGSPLLRMYGGTHGFVDALSTDLVFYSGAKVSSVKCAKDRVEVTNTQGISCIVDKVVVATPTHVIDFLDEENFAEELKILRQYQFTQGELFIHTDERCMPEQKKHWSALSYCMNRNYGHQMFSVWLNAVEPSLVGKKAIFQTWNPTIKIENDKIIDRVVLTRAIVDQHTLENTRRLKDLQCTKNRQVYFCGSWSCDGMPILESAVTSAMFVAEQIGVKAQFEGLVPTIIPAKELDHVVAI